MINFTSFVNGSSYATYETFSSTISLAISTVNSSEISPPNDYYESWPRTITYRLHGLAVMAMLCIVLVTLIGNTLVIVSVFTNRNLRTITNYFVVSLAFADLFVALTVLPFHIVHYVTTPRWIFSKAVCVWFTSMDVLLCTSSIWNLCAISLDRYMAISRPLTYSAYRSKSLALTIIAAAWILSVLVTCPCIVIQLRVDMNERCELPDQKAYIVYSALGSFYVPLFIMIFFYSRIFTVARKSSRRHINASHEGQKSSSDHKSSIGSLVCIPGDCCYFHSGDQCSHAKQSSALSKLTTPTTALTHTPNDSPESDLNIEFGRRCSDLTLRYDTAMEDDISDDDTGFGVITTSIELASSDVREVLNIKPSDNSKMAMIPAAQQSQESRVSVIGHKKKQHDNNQVRHVHTKNSGGVNALKREAKTAKTLAVVVGCFTVCWLPFSVLYVSGLGCKVNQVAMLAATWLGYLNSAVNPFIYAFYNRHFLDSFKRLTIGICTPNSERSNSTAATHFRL